MSGVISSKENEYISGLKRYGVLQKFNPEEIRGIDENGGVAVVCSDGDIDAEPFHRRISHRPHAVRIFGGPLLLAPGFGGYDAGLERRLIENIKQGMEVKKTRTLYLYFHAPCGMALAHHHDIRETLEMAKATGESLASDEFFSKVFTLFHVKRINKGGDLEQNIYILR